MSNSRGMLGVANGGDRVREHHNHKRFSIEDAFEEETEDAIKVYGATTPAVPHICQGMKGKFRDMDIGIEHKPYKCSEDTTSRDSDSLIHEYLSSNQNTDVYCWRHPKVRENWKTVLGAVILLLVGTGLLGMGAFAVADPENGIQGAVFFLAGLICFVPGAYHVVYICLAARGKRGYDFYHLPLFT